MMKTFKAKEDFSAYPAGKRHDYTAGEEYSGADTFVDMLVGKGHVTEIKPPEEEKPKPPVRRARADTEDDGA